MITICEAIRRSESAFCTGDSTFSIVAILEKVLPEGCVADRPFSYRDSDDPEIEGFTYTSDWDVGFKITFPDPVAQGLDGSGLDLTADTQAAIAWTIDTLERVLDLEGRYSSNTYGPGVAAYLMVPSLSFDTVLIGNAVEVRFWFDDSTR